MRKLFVCLILILSFWLPVKAKDYELNTLIPLDEVVTVHTEKFDYINFSFSSKINEKGNGTIQFQSIHNNMVTKVPVSINILLFDNDKINIGYLTYCSDKDYSSQYSAFKLRGGEASAFSIIVTPTYFEDGKSAKDVAYIAVADENKYCYIGGYTKYVGQTIEKILGKEEVNPKENHFMGEILNTILDFLQSKIFKIILMAIGGIVLFIAFGILLNSLYQRMYTHRTFLVFVPVADIYITVKLVFGNIIAIIYGILLVGSGVLYYFKIPILLYIVGGIWIISILLVIVKLITKKYDLFYFEPAMDSSKYHTKQENNTNSLLVTEEESLLDDEPVSLSLGAGGKKDAEKEISDIDEILKSLENPDGIDDED